MLPICMTCLELAGPGMIVLTGPSSCGKGEIGKALSSIFNIQPQNYLSMGEILRQTFARSKTDPAFAAILQTEYFLSWEVSVFDCLDTNNKLTEKIYSYKSALESYIGKSLELCSQLDWLEFCTVNGLLVPNRWTEVILENYLKQNPQLQHSAFVLDGYPRTAIAAQHLVETVQKYHIPVLKVLHISISKTEMLARATFRNRIDDQEDILKSRFDFYINSVQPSVDVLKKLLGNDYVALIDGHQPVYNQDNSVDVSTSIKNVVHDCLVALGFHRDMIQLLLRTYQTLPQKNL
jgi:adenylate kinase family enzyme